MPTGKAAGPGRPIRWIIGAPPAPGRVTHAIVRAAVFVTVLVFGVSGSLAQRSDRPHDTPHTPAARDGYIAVDARSATVGSECTVPPSAKDRLSMVTVNERTAAVPSSRCAGPGIATRRGSE